MKSRTSLSAMTEAVNSVRENPASEAKTAELDLTGRRSSIKKIEKVMYLMKKIDYSLLFPSS